MVTRVRRSGDGRKAKKNRREEERDGGGRGGEKQELASPLIQGMQFRLSKTERTF